MVSPTLNATGEDALEDVLRETDDVIAQKSALREEVWNCLEASDAVWFPRPCHGRVPNCFGSADACWQLLQMPELRAAKVVKVHPSIGATALRSALVRSGKIVLVPPYPGEDHLYLQLDASMVKDSQDLTRIGDKRVYPKWARPLNLDEIPTIDVCVVAAVAVEPDRGRRLGKGKGYGEMEYGILCEIGAVSERTLICTVCHDLQVLPSSRFPAAEEHDLPVDVIATQTRLLRVPQESRATKPSGVFWDRVSPQMMKDIGALTPLRALSQPDLESLRSKHAAGHSRPDARVAVSWDRAVADAWERSSAEEWRGWEVEIKRSKRNAKSARSFKNSSVAS